jgi:putative oxidoreductase
VAIFSVHISHGLFISNNGYEFALALFAATFALAIQGGGKFAIDNRLLGATKTA